MTRIRRIFLPLLAAALAGAALGAPPAARKALGVAVQTAGGSHASLLAWTDADFGVVSGLTFTVLRAAGPCSASAAFASVASGLTAESYTDAAVTAGASYCYEVEAVAPSGAKSAPSNQAGDTIPLAAPALTVASQ